MGIGVHTDMATPALAQYGSDELKRNFLAPAIAGDGLFCLGTVSPRVIFPPKSTFSTVSPAPVS